MGVNMNADTTPLSSHREDARTDWSAQLKLAFVVSVFAALSAVALAGHLSESVIICGVIVLATMASWFQMERPVLEHALTRTSRR
jgi:hypothetical protein